MKHVLVILTIALTLALCGSALAQSENNVYFTTYYANNVTGAPDATVRFINDGDTGGTLYADFYVFDDSQELTECCSCPITPDGLLSESVRTQLTANPLTGKVPTRGVIKVISDSAGNQFNATPTPGLRGWATHIQSFANRYPNGPAPYYQTETEVADSNLTASEQTLLQNLCYYDKLLSGKPCTCTSEDFDF